MLVKGDRYENLSPEAYLNMIRPYLVDFINKHKPIEELNNNNNNNNNNDTDGGERKIQLTMQNSCISAKNFEETCTTYTWSKLGEIFMGSDTENVIDTIFDTFLQNFQRAQETSNEIGSEFILIVLYYYITIFIE